MEKDNIPQNDKRLSVLFLSAWYPNRDDQMSGLFVRKHAEAAARQVDVYSLYLSADSELLTHEVIEQETNGVKEIYVYYPFIDAPLLRPLTKALGFVIAFGKGYEHIVSKYGKPDVTQANVLTRCGVLAYWLKKRHDIPYIIVEHWSRYLRQNNNYKGAARKMMTKLCVRSANHVLAVTENLKEAMQSHGLHNPNFGTIDNVVDDFFYENNEKTTDNSSKFKFLHISCFDERSKNIKGMLRAAAKLAEKRKDFNLTLVGTGHDWQSAVDYAKDLRLSDIVCFVGEKTPVEVKEYFKDSDAFILFSNYENAPVVISEALATGTPVLSTNVGGIPNMVNEECGILIAPNDESALTKNMAYIMEHREMYDSARIKQHADRYRYDTVGNKLYQIYKKTVKGHIIGENTVGKTSKKSNNSKNIYHFNSLLRIREMYQRYWRARTTTLNKLYIRIERPKSSNMTPT